MWFSRMRFSIFRFSISPDLLQIEGSFITWNEFEMNHLGIRGSQPLKDF